MRQLLSILLCLTSISIYSQQNYYVSSSLGDNNNAGTSENSPFQTINRAFDNVEPGDTIYVMDGTYTNPDYGTASPHSSDGSQSTNMNNPPAVIVNKSGTAGNYITLRNLPGHNPKIKFDGRGGILINGPQSYLIIEGFEIEGPGASITYDQAIADRKWKVKADQEDLNYNHSYFASFGIWSGFSQDFLHHHVIIRNNIVHHTTGSGIRFNDSDHITIENNTVYNTTWWTSNASSAIVFAECKALSNNDNGDDIKMIMRGNTVYNNWNRIPFYMTSGKIPPNGNPPSGSYGNADYSTILDGQGLYVTRSDDDYYGTFLFENNLCVNNGKNGINFDRSEGSSALIRNNTIYFNGVHEIIQDISVSEGNPAHRGQKVAGIKANYFRNVTIVNNIVVTREYDFYAMQIQNQQSDGTVKEANNNIFVNGKLPGYTSQQTGEYVTHSWVTDDNQIISGVDFSNSNYKDPVSFVNAPPIVNGPIDMTPTNFQLKSDSPAINAGEQANTPERDILGNLRPLPPSDALAYSSFESSLGGWSAWSTANDNNEVSLSSETSRTGNQSLKVFGRTKDFHSAKYNISQLDVGSSYSLFIYAKLPEGKSGTAQLMLRKIVDGQGTSNALMSPVEINSNDWTRLSADYTHSEMDNNSFFFVKGPPVTGSDGIDYYLDDFSLVNQGTGEVDFTTVGDIVDIGAYEFIQIDDDDGDGVANSEDNCPETPNSDQNDADGDGIGDVCDDDDDNDGVLDDFDQDPLDPYICADVDNDGCDDCSQTGPNSSGGDPSNDGKDTDADGICDQSDPDDDNDGILDENDNCPETPNSDQKDTDGDGLGDVCDDDDDGDGVSDSNDNCPNTPQGTRVDVNGCPVFELPLNNFKVEVGSATCIGNSDGVINLSVEDASYDYSVTVTGQSDLSITGTSTTASVTGLAKGTYEVCFKVVGQDGYEQCFEVVVGEPKPLSAFIDVDSNSGRMSVTMGGSSMYYVNINGVNTRVDGDTFETELSTGLSIITISTDLECQGVVKQEVFISEKIHYYPNPTLRNVNVHVGGEDATVRVSVFSEKGDLIYTRDQSIEQGSRKIHIDLTNQITGTYIVTLESKTVRQSFKIIRE